MSNVELIPHWSPSVDVTDLTIETPDENGWHRVTAYVKHGGSNPMNTNNGVLRANTVGQHPRDTRRP